MIRRCFIALFFAVVIGCLPYAFCQRPSPKENVYDFSLVDLNGKIVSLSTYKGKLLLILNLASQSGYRDQIAALSELQKTYESKGLVLGIPSSDFGGEELKDAAAVKNYYFDTAKIPFLFLLPP